MSRNDKRYYKNLHDQAYDKMMSMMAQGESKLQAKKDGTAKDKIFSYATYATYWQHIKYFISWLNKAHPECTTLKKARKYVPEWLSLRESHPYSAWTIHTEAKALGKLFGISPCDKDYYVPPKRNRADIKRSRYEVKSDKYFSEVKHEKLIKFCRGTGLRRHELEKLRPKDLRSREMLNARLAELLGKSSAELSSLEIFEKKVILDALQFEENYFLFVKGKGGRIRYSPIISNEQLILDKIQNTPQGDKVWGHVCSADIHSFRGDYCASIYKSHARKIEDIPYDKISKNGILRQSDVYCCKGDRAGKKYDRAALIMCSHALGHNREEVVVRNYLYKE